MGDIAHPSYTLVLSKAKIIPARWLKDKIMSGSSFDQDSLPFI